LSDYFEVMTRAVFQSRMPWRVIEAKWDGFRAAFGGFDPRKVARFTKRDVERLMKDPGIVRNRRKIEATVQNAQTMLALDEGHGGFKRFLRSHEDFEETSAALVKRFQFLGDLGAYYFLWVVSERVPSYEEWCRSRGVTPRAMGDG
jgi:DNA-3-methyladenine glycosylase I